MSHFENDPNLHYALYMLNDDIQEIFKKNSDEVVILSPLKYPSIIRDKLSAIALGGMINHYSYKKDNTTTFPVLLEQNINEMSPFIFLSLPNDKYFISHDEMVNVHEYNPQNDLETIDNIRFWLSNTTWSYGATLELVNETKIQDL